MEEKKAKKSAPKVILSLDWGTEEEVDYVMGKYYICKSGAKYNKNNPHIAKVKTVKAKAVKTEVE